MGNALKLYLVLVWPLGQPNEDMASTFQYLVNASLDGQSGTWELVVDDSSGETVLESHGIWPGNSMREGLDAGVEAQRLESTLWMKISTQDGCSLKLLYTVHRRGKDFALLSIRMKWEFDGQDDLMNFIRGTLQAAGDIDYAQLSLYKLGKQEGPAPAAAETHTR